MAITIGTAGAKDKPSEAFLKKAIEGNFAEVSMGDLAQKNGQSDAVKSFGKMLSTDHAAANQEAMDAAKGMGMNPPSGQNVKNVRCRLRQDVRNTHGRRPSKRYRRVQESVEDEGCCRRICFRPDRHVAETFRHCKIAETGQVIW